ncbi:hypothetical protein RRG48_05130 [Mycoplasmopsis canis]|uniref:hypothetical protein n=1 Tax=Mycoplasmopsis cynos TaxID=171284 RepID=UPI002B003807|nr:hypothetical protein [Mycoplasmopsis cynos]WQQ13501.1 hypothetical protein RRG58_02000 [Mycoplasmopsis cynos]WQQ13939.1 hypothetical protein RRG52_00085 [Mycoplasmopsis cynos]
MPFTSSLFKYYYNTNFENKNLNFRKYNFKHTHLMTYAPVSKLSKLFSPLNINNIYFQMFLDEIYIIDNEVFKNIVDTFSEFAKSNIYFRLLLRNLEFRKADVENKKNVFKQDKNVLIINYNDYDKLICNSRLFETRWFEFFNKKDSNDKETKFVRNIKLNENLTSNQILKKLLYNETKIDFYYEKLTNNNWLTQYIVFDFILNEKDVYDEIVDQLKKIDNYREVFTYKTNTISEKNLKNYSFHFLKNIK